MCYISRIYLIQIMTLGNLFSMFRRIGTCKTLVAMPPTPPTIAKGVTSSIFAHINNTHMELQKALKCMIQILHFPIYTMFLKEYLEDDLRWVSNYKNQKNNIYI